MYIERRRKKLYALHDIPADLRPRLGKARFVVSLDTEDMREAKRRAAYFEAHWRGLIDAARKGEADPRERDARFFRQALREAPEDQRSAILDQIHDQYDGMWQEAASAAGIIDHRDPRIADLPGMAEADRFIGEATGVAVPFLEHRDEWVGTLRNVTPQTIGMWKRTLELFADECPTLRDVTRRKVQQWVNKRSEEGKAPKTVLGYLIALRSYWRYLIAIEAVPEDPFPFDRLAMPRDEKRGGEDDVDAYTPKQAAALLKAAEGKGDARLADLIRVAMYTGMRIDEICRLKATDVEDGQLHVREGKTKAAVRQVPIHPQLAETIERLRLNAAKRSKTDSDDAYLLAGLNFDKNGKRNGAMSQAFSKFKKKQGFTERHNFHSFRHTFTTMLEDAGVQVNVVQALIGHKKASLAFGHYSKAQVLNLKVEALVKVVYPKVALAIS